MLASLTITAFAIVAILLLALALLSMMTPQSIGGDVNNQAKLTAFQWTTVAASDIIPITTTRLSNCLCAVATIQDDAADGISWATITPNSDGTATLKTWKNTSGSDPTPLAATSFGVVVNVMVFGYKAAR